MEQISVEYVGAESLIPYANNASVIIDRWESFAGQKAELYDKSEMEK